MFCLLFRGVEREESPRRKGGFFDLEIERGGAPRGEAVWGAHRSVDRKRERGHVKRRQKVSRQSSTFFDNSRAGPKTSSILTKSLRHFSTIIARHLFSGVLSRSQKTKTHESLTDKKVGWGKTTPKAPSKTLHTWPRGRVKMEPFVLLVFFPLFHSDACPV